MREGQWVLLAFAATAVTMIALPVVTVWTATRPGPPDKGLDGAISKAFLAAATKPGDPALSPKTVPAVATLLPKGMPETAVFKTVAASGFTCSTDSDAATCHRSYAELSCRDDWTIRLIFRDDGTVWSSTAQRMTTCL